MRVIKVVARLCDGGHRCSPPKECCPQGCCYLYAPPSAPRSLPPATDHVLNLFFINHWYFWCLVVAIILAILCACSLWKKRRQLCGWGLSDRHTQSEGDSAGSCYAPPQYSRCSSFHHPPPPYTEVTSKPDLYPLVFTCNGDNGKNGASYLMVQYFRNYIVRPAGSLSATSTVDSLSSSFICNANEANTLVPPPYSRAASPDAVGITTHFQHFMMPRSASQLVCSQQQLHGQDMIQQQILQSRQNASNMTNNSNINNSNSSSHYYFPNSTQLRTSESVNFQNIRFSGSGSGLGNEGANRTNAVIIGSQSDQQFRYIANSNSNLSDIFVNSGSCNNNSSVNNNNNNARMSGTDAACQAQAQINNNLNYNNKSSTNQFAATNNLSTNPVANNSTNSNNNPIYNSCSSIGGISITVPVAPDANAEYRDLHALRRSLETCCQILQQHQMPSDSFNSADSPVNVELGKKFETGMRSYVTSTTCSAVSSLANIGSPSSPPQATSPTGEVKELLEQIRQLKPESSIDSTASDPPPETLHTVSTIPEDPPRQPHPLQKSSAHGGLPKNPLTSALSRRPSTLQSRKKFFSSGSSSSSSAGKPNKAMYIPINNYSVRTTLRSPVGAATNILTRGRGRRGWISRSAPTTPGTTLPPSRLGDDSPLLLNEHDEDNEQNQ
ncbi:probable serine/threonine-protein kinase dyrk2 isoform X2 [Hermetia illucens]|uniref:probable serine/threonine-protein kinase dyrk2 isoform X2 n=1 Tax=Hermetia illucens TaxID=343691 RepID=UPI0018CC36AC|nr:probable serine/threonine-protein kinase dyrk2 isoform X2 [Hermetia illucens]